MIKNKVPVINYTLADDDFTTVDFDKYGAGVTYHFFARDLDDMNERKQFIKGKTR